MTSWIKKEIQRQSKLEGKIRLSFQLVLLSVAVVMAFTLTVATIINYWMLGESLRDSMTTRYKDEVQHNVETMITTLEAIVSSEFGPNMELTALRSVTNIIHEAQYANGLGYFFVFDIAGNVIRQRIHRHREGTNRFNEVDDDGKHYVQMLIQAARQGGDFVEYKMDKPGEEGKGGYNKIAYAKLLRGGQWWVGSGVYVDAIDTDIRAQNKKVLLQVGSVMILSGGFFLGLLWIAIRLSAMLGRRITGPIAQLVDGVNTLSAGNYGYRVEVDTHDELKLLADRFNIMSTTIDQQNKTMRALKSAVNNKRRLLGGQLHNRGGDFVLEIKKLFHQIGHESEEDGRKELLDRCSECVGRFKQECNAIALGVYPKTVDDLGVAKAFKYFVEEKTAQDNKLDVDPDIDMGMPQSDKEREVALYLVAQALVLNVLQHAQASEMSISLKYADEGVILTVHDDGIGFNRDAVLKDKSIEAAHIGIPWVIAQVEEYKGHVDIDTSPGAGTKMRVTMPWPKEHFVSEVL